MNIGRIDKLKTLENKEALKVIANWAAEAEQALEGKDGPDASVLCFLLRKQAIHRVAVSADLYEQNQLVEFDIDGPLKAGRKTRFMLPVHFAITRLLEIIPDVRLRLINKGRTDAADERYFNMVVRYHPRFAKTHDLTDANRLERIIFNAPPDAEVGERRGGDYRRLIPSEYVLSKNRGYNKQGAERWVRICESVFAVPGDPLGTLPKVMRQLMIIAERWHWGDLSGRLPDDPRISSLRGPSCD
jgi:hypothetical protein